MDYWPWSNSTCYNLGKYNQCTTTLPKKSVVKRVVFHFVDHLSACSALSNRMWSVGFFPQLLSVSRNTWAVQHEDWRSDFVGSIITVQSTVSPAIGFKGNLNLSSIIRFNIVSYVFISVVVWFNKGILRAYFDEAILRTSAWGASECFHFPKFTDLDCAWSARKQRC